LMMIYLPHSAGRAAWSLPAQKDHSAERDEDGLPIPPLELLEGYSPSVESYLIAGRHHIAAMLEALRQDGFELPLAPRVLDFGCGIGRLIRRLYGYARAGQVWGVDISASHIHWCNRNLWPPFRFAVTTTVPHLPFKDGYFDLIYAGSVFTHIEDLADAWLAELHRILAPSGYGFLTYHDDNFIRLLLSTEHNPELRRVLLESDEFVNHRDDFGVMTIGRGSASQVFYRRSFLSERLNCAGFVIRGIHEAIWGYQTGYVVTPEADPHKSAGLRPKFERLSAAHGTACEERAAAITERDEALAARDAAITERDQALAARDVAMTERDQAFAARDAAVTEHANKNNALRGIQDSIAWRIASPLWRLETRGERKRRRALK
jgi:SAM-dependent methyltransferase